MKKGKRLLILLAIVVAFGAGAYLLNLNTQRQEAAKEAEEETEKTVLFSAAEDDVTKIDFTHEGEAIALAKQDDTWVYAPRESFQLDTSAVDDMLSDLTEVDAVRTVAESEGDADPAEYGLDEPAVTITVTDTDGNTKQISIGDKNATTGNYYAMAEGVDGIYTISSDLYNTFDVSLMDLLTSEDYPTVDADAVTDLTWDDGETTKDLEYHPDGDASAYSSAFTWFEKAEDGTLTAVNADTVSDLLDAATGISYKSTVADTKDDLAAYGLDTPSLSLTLRYTEDVVESEAAAAIAEEEAAATPTPTATPSPTPTATPTPSPTPTATPTAEPTATPTAEPTATPTAEPTATPTAEPTATPTVEPTATPTAEPTATPTAEPTDTPALEPTDTPEATVAVSSFAAAVAEEADAVPTDEPTEEPTATPTATPEPTVAVDRSLTIWLGDTDADGNVYMTHSKTDRIFLISADTAEALRKLTADDLRSDVPVNIVRSDLTGMIATMNGVTKTVTTSTETSTSTDGDVTTTVVYQIDGKELKSTLFSFFVNTLNSIKAEAYTDQPVAADAEPILDATFTQNRTGFETVTVAFYPYDGSFDQAVVNGDSTMLVNKRDVDDLQSYFDELVATEPTATPEATATPAPEAE